MKILHVVLGNPYTHQGGLCRYCYELMEAQKEAGHFVYVLYPREYITGKKPQIIKRKKNEFYIFDALPVAITYGVGDPSRYTVTVNDKCYKSWLKKNAFDIIHVHSVQGVHKEFFFAAKELGIPLLYTTHDYYCFCPRCVLVDRNGSLCEDHNPEKCAVCNHNAGLSAKKQRVIQSNIYQVIKNSNLIKALKKIDSVSETEVNETQINFDISKECISQYKKLNDYYYEIVNCFSLIHCNSNVSADNYSKYFPEVNQSVVPITHAGLKRETHFRDSDTLTIGYMGGMSEHKGYKVLYKALKELDRTGFENWKVHLYGGDFSQKIIDSRYYYGGFFTREEETDVWECIDVLVVASQCMETFGFIVLEALCKGIPVICSDLVGAKDLVTGIDKALVFPHSDGIALAKCISGLMDREYYDQITERIKKTDLSISMNSHAAQINDLYCDLIGKVK